MANFETANRICIVTGANRGLGLGCVAELLRQGFTVVACARKTEGIADALKSQKIPTEKLHLKSLDVANEESLRSFEADLKKNFGRCDVLINNAGVFLDDPKGGPIATPGDTFLKTMMTNLYGPYRLCQIVLPFMKTQGFGRIVNVSSGMGQLSEMGTGYASYRISKTALNSLTRNLAADLGSGKILVNAVCPGWVKTDMGGKSAQREIPEGVKSILWAALLPGNGPSGGYFRDGKALSW